MLGSVPQPGMSQLYATLVQHHVSLQEPLIHVSQNVVSVLPPVALNAAGAISRSVTFFRLRVGFFMRFPPLWRTRR